MEGVTGPKLQSSLEDIVLIGYVVKDVSFRLHQRAKNVFAIMYRSQHEWIGKACVRVVIVVMGKVHKMRQIDIDVRKGQEISDDVVVLMVNGSGEWSVALINRVDIVAV